MVKIKKRRGTGNFAIPLLSVSSLLIFLLVFIFTSNSVDQQFLTITIGDDDIVAEVADTDRKRIRGLSGRDTLNEGSGMIFIFDKSGYHPFWMKGMNFPVDIIWINGGMIVYITHQAQPEDKNIKSNRIYKPESPARYVLEINSGHAKNNNINVGEKVESSIF